MKRKETISKESKGKICILYRRNEQWRQQIKKKDERNLTTKEDR